MNATSRKPFTAFTQSPLLTLHLFLANLDERMNNTEAAQPPAFSIAGQAVGVASRKEPDFHGISTTVTTSSSRIATRWPSGLSENPKLRWYVVLTGTETSSCPFAE